MACLLRVVSRVTPVRRSKRGTIAKGLSHFGPSPTKENARRDPAKSRTIDLMIMGLVLGNVVAVVLESVASIHAVYQDLFTALEQVAEPVQRVTDTIAGDRRSRSQYSGWSRSSRTMI
jgi:hypothetical protein